MSGYLLSPCDRAIAEAQASPCAHAERRPRLILATTILASSLAFIDGSVVNVGLPAIGRSLGADGAGLSWIVNGYLLPLSALLLLGGAAGDRFGRRRMLMFGVMLFAMASLLCALAANLGWLVAGRVLQGAGAALLMPNSLAILGASFDGEARGRAIGIWAGVGAVAAAIGPLVGGELIDLAGWRTIFLINLPVAALTLIVGARALHDDDDGGVRTQHLDLAGAATVSVGLACLTWGLSEASAAGAITGVAGLTTGIGAAILALFVVIESKIGDKAMLPLAVFDSRSFVGLNLLTFLLYGALGVLLVAVPFVLIEAAGYSATAAGAALLPLPIVIALGSPVMGRIAAKTGPRLPLTVAPVVVAAGFFMAARIGGAANYWSSTLPALLLIACGMAGAVAPLTSAVVGSAGTQHTGLASGFNSAVARSGGLIATALLGTMLAARGATLVAAFHVAVMIAGVAALAAAVCAFVWLAPGTPGEP